MFDIKIGGNASQPQPTNKGVQLHKKILELAQGLFMDELFEDTLFACGDDFTSKSTGQYGTYETVRGEVISFQPKPNLEFMLVCDEFVIVDNLEMIKTVAYHVDDYQLAMAS